MSSANVLRHTSLPSSSWFTFTLTVAPLRRASSCIHGHSSTGTRVCSGENWKMPCPTRFIASAIPYNSSGAAVVPGTSSPLLLRCRGVREVEKPSAPARSASSVSLLISAMSSDVATSLFAPRSPMTNARNAPCAICVPKSMTCGLRSSASRYSGNDSHSQVIPSTIAEPGISSTPSMSSISH